MSSKIFISYNHQDQGCAIKIKDRLAAKGWEVLLDVVNMQSGENIEQFITNCIRETDITLTVISANSLLSAWVATETIATHLDKQLSNRRFIPCYIDDEFFDRSFSGKAMQAIEDNLKEIDKMIGTAIERGWGIEDLQGERSRYLKLKINLPEIIGQLRSMLCINLAGGHFEAGMQKVLNDLGQPPSIELKKSNTEVLNRFNEKIQSILDEGEKQRLQSLQNRLIQLQNLLSKYEEELDFETDPKRQMRYEKEIDNTKRSLQKIADEIQSF